MTRAGHSIITLRPPVRPAWRHAAEPLWPAWQSLSRWEETSAAELGPPFGVLVLVLWSLHRFGGTDVGDVLTTELYESMSGAGWDPLLEDIAECAFALGAGWAESRARRAG